MYSNFFLLLLFFTRSIYSQESLIKNEIRVHDDVARVPGWIRVPSVVESEVEDAVGTAEVKLQSRLR